MPMPGTTMIIGLPSIIFHFFDYFSDLLQQARRHASQILQLNSSLPTNVEEYSDGVETWSTPQLPDSPEELSTLLPSSFSGPLYFLELTYEEALQLYHSQFSSHVSPDFLAAVPELTALLQSDLATQVFVPQTWTGLTGLSLITIQFSDLLPASLRPKATPVNPKLNENAEIEFKRLLKYF
jgi:hypothetical protein